MMFRLNPFYPPIEWTRERAENSKPATVDLTCQTCRYTVYFVDVYERDRFMQPTGLKHDGRIQPGWRTNPVLCPVCQ